MKIAMGAESDASEPRVAATPDTVKKMIALGAEVAIEPGAGVNSALLDTIIERVAEINRRGITFLIIEHNMDLIARLCRHVFVLAAGRMLFEGTPQAVIASSDVIEAYLGTGTS